MNNPTAASRGIKNLLTRQRLKQSFCAMAAISALAGLSACSSIDTGGYQNYESSAIARQQALETGADTTTSVTEVLSGALPNQPKSPPASMPASSAMPGGRAIELSLTDALVLGLKNNPSLLVEQFAPAISQQQVQAQRGAFDPTLSGSVQASKIRGPASSAGYVTTNAGTAQAGIAENLPTGTGIQANLNSNLTNAHTGTGQATDVGGSLTLTQALLQGASIQANLAGIREAQIGEKISAYELRGEALTITDDIIQAYWAYVLAQQNVDILKQALSVARQQEDQTRELIRVGRTSPSELPASVAQTAVTRVQLLSAVGTLKISRLNLLSFIAPANRPFWQDHITLTTPPYIPKGPVAPLNQHMNLALHMSPILNQARLQIQQGDLSVIQTRNGLLPVLNLFITMGKTGYAESFGPAANNLNGSDYQLIGGLSFDYPLFNRTPTANYQTAVLTRDQQEAALADTVRSVELSVRTAYIQTVTDKQQISATAATTQAQAETLRSTQAELTVGESTSLQVALAQSNLLAARLAQAQAVVAYLDARATLYLQEGSLLERCRMKAPGAAPVKSIGPSWLRRWPDGYFH